MKRSDSKANLDKVAAELVKTPLASQREIAKSAGIGNATAHRAMTELEQTGAVKDQRIINLTDDDFEVVRQTQLGILFKLENDLGDISARDLAYIGDVSAKRYAIFRGEATGADGGLKESILDRIARENAGI